MVKPDVVIVGGGVNGVAVAFHLARRGVRVTVVERDSVAAGPTGRSCGLVRQHYSHPTTARMALESLRVFQRFDELVGGECDFRQTGALVLAGPQEVESLTANVAMQRGVGIDSRLLSPREAAEIEPHADLDGVAAAAWEPEAGYADAYATSQAFAQRARQLGAELRTGTTVSSVVVDGGRATGVVTDRGVIAAGAVVLAAGPWSAPLARGCGIELPLVAARVQVCLFDKPPEIERHGIVLDTALGIYTRPEGEELMLTGSLDTSEAENAVDDPDAYDETADFERTSRYADRLVRRYPAMVDGRLRSGYASLYDVTPDWQPVLDELPGVGGLYCCAGSSGHGFKLAPVVGEMMAGLIVDGKPAGGPLDLFAFSRFASEAAPLGRYEQKILG